MQLSHPTSWNYYYYYYYYYSSAANHRCAYPYAQELQISAKLHTLINMGAMVGAGE